MYKSMYIGCQGYTHICTVLKFTLWNVANNFEYAKQIK